MLNYALSAKDWHGACGQWVGGKISNLKLSNTHRYLAESTVFRSTRQTLKQRARATNIRHKAAGPGDRKVCRKSCEMV